MHQIVPLAALALTLCSCSMQKQTTSTSKTLGIYGAGVIQKPVLVNLKMNPQKFTSRYSAGNAQGIDYHKSQAVAKAMIEHKADVIIEPAYEIVSSGTNVSIVITAYAGSYENFRQLTGADTALLINTGIIDYNNGPGQTPAPKVIKKKNKGIWAALGLLAIGAAISGSGL